MRNIKICPWAKYSSDHKHEFHDRNEMTFWGPFAADRFPSVSNASAAASYKYLLGQLTVAAFRYWREKWQSAAFSNSFLSPPPCMAWQRRHRLKKERARERSDRSCKDKRKHKYTRKYMYSSAQVEKSLFGSTTKLSYMYFDQHCACRCPNVGVVMTHDIPS